MYRVEGTDESQDDDYDVVKNQSVVQNSSLGQIHSRSRSAFFFTEQPVNGWNSSLHNIPDSDEDENDVEDQSVAIKSYAGFEKKLKEGFLEASNLGLVCAPPAIFDYKPPLRRVDLKDNKIETLPEHFFDELPMLQWCDLRYNRINRLPSLQARHENLNVLLVQDNDLTSLPYTLAHADKLHTIGWTNNDIENPPRDILFQGCKAILDYLRKELSQRLPVDEKGNLISLEGDEQLKKDLADTIKKSWKKRSTSCTSFPSGISKNSTIVRRQEELKQKKLIDRLKYTWGLWKNVPYDGVSNQKLFEKSVQEVKDEVTLKFNRSKECILQKMRDNDALANFRKDTRLLQMKGPTKPFEGVSVPFGTDYDEGNNNNEHENENKQEAKMDPEAFRSTLAECMKKLRSFAETPAPLNDTEKSMQRLKEVENVQRKLLDMKLKWSVKSSKPV